MATAPIYCSHKELKRVYPSMDAFDTKTPLYGFSIGYTNWYDSVIDIYYANNTGLVTDLFWDGAKLKKVAYNTTATTTLAEVLTSTDTSTINVASSTNIAAGDIIKIDDEYMNVTASAGVDGTTITVGTVATNRGLFGTSISNHANSSNIYKIFEGSDMGAAASASDAAVFVYDSDLDLLIMGVDSKNPNDYLIESGEDFTTLVTQFRTDASRYLDSKLDPNLPREQLKDKSGNYDYMIIRTTALIAATFMIRASDPTNETANALMEEAQGNIDALNEGKAALSWQTTRDASRGIIREVGTISGGIRPVDTRGIWYGTYDLIKVRIIDSGVLGTSTYSVWVKDGDKLKSSQVVTAQKINGDYQAISDSLEIRFAGETDAASATAGDEWEIEVMGASEHIDAAGVKSVANTRWLGR